MQSFFFIWHEYVMTYFDTLQRTVDSEYYVTLKKDKSDKNS